MNIQPSHQLLTYDYKIIEDPNKKNDLPAFNPRELIHPSENLKNYLIENGFIDELGNCTEKLYQIPLPHLNNLIFKRIEEFLCMDRTLYISSDFTPSYPLASLLKQLYSYSKGQCTEITLIGGALQHLIGLEYYLECLSYLHISDCQSYLSDEFIQKMQTIPSDNDLRFILPDATDIDLKKISNYLIKIFSKYLNDNSSFREKFNFIKNNAFYKYKHINIDNVHYFVNTLKDNVVTEILFIQQLKRSYLFTLDALQLNLLPFLFNHSHCSSLSTPFESLWTPIIHKMIGIIDTYDFETLDHLTFPIYLSHLMKGSICLKKEVEEAVIETFKKFFLLKNNNISNHFIITLNNVIVNHFQGNLEVKLIYFLNCLLLLEKYLTPEQFINLRKLFSRSVQEEYISHPMHLFLYDCETSFKHYKNCLLLSSILLKTKQPSHKRMHCQNSMRQLPALYNSIFLLLEEAPLQNLNSFSEEIKEYSDIYFQNIYTILDSSEKNIRLPLERNEQIFIENLINNLLLEQDLRSLNLSLLLFNFCDFKNSIFLTQFLKNIPQTLYLLNEVNQKNFILLLCKHLNLNIEKIYNKIDIQEIHYEFSIVLANSFDPLLNDLAWELYPKNKNPLLLIQKLLPHNLFLVIKIINKNNFLIVQYFQIYEFLFSSITSLNQFLSFQEIIEKYFTISFTYWLNHYSEDHLRILESLLVRFLSCNYYQLNKSSNEILNFYITYFNVPHQIALKLKIEWLIHSFEKNSESCISEWRLFEEKLNLISDANIYNQFLLKLIQSDHITSKDLDKISHIIKFTLLSKSDQLLYKEFYEKQIKSFMLKNPLEISPDQLQKLKLQKNDKKTNQIFNIYSLKKEIDEANFINRELITKFIKIRQIDFPQIYEEEVLKSCYISLISKLTKNSKSDFAVYSEIVCHKNFKKIFPIQNKENQTIYIQYLDHISKYYYENLSKTHQNSILFIFNILMENINSNFQDLLWEKALNLCLLLIKKNEQPTKDLKAIFQDKNLEILQLFEKNSKKELIVSLLVFLNFYKIKTVQNEIFLNAIIHFFSSEKIHVHPEYTINTICNFIQNCTPNSKLLEIFLLVTKLYINSSETYPKAYFWLNKWIEGTKILNESLDKDKFLPLITSIYHKCTKEEYYNLLFLLDPIELNLFDLWKKLILNTLEESSIDQGIKQITFLYEHLTKDLFFEHFTNEYSSLIQLLSKSNDLLHINKCIDFLLLNKNAFLNLDLNNFINKVASLKHNESLKKKFWNYFENHLKHQNELINCDQKQLSLGLIKCLLSFNSKMAFKCLEVDFIFEKILFSDLLTFNESNELYYELSLALIRDLDLKNEKNESKYINFILNTIDDIQTNSLIENKKFSILLDLFFKKFVETKVESTFIAVCTFFYLQIKNDEINEIQTKFSYKLFQNHFTFVTETNDITGYVLKILELILSNSKYLNINNLLENLIKVKLNGNPHFIIYLFSKILENAKLKKQLKNKKNLISLIDQFMQDKINIYQIKLLSNPELMAFIGTIEYGNFWINLLKSFNSIPLTDKLKDYFINKFCKIFFENSHQILLTPQKYQSIELFFNLLIKVCDDKIYYQHYYPILAKFFNQLISFTLKSSELKNHDIIWENVEESPFPMTLGKSDKENLNLNFYTYALLLIKLMNQSNLTLKEFIFKCDNLCSLTFLKLFNHCPNLMKIAENKALLIEYITNKNYRLYEDTFIFHGKLISMIYSSAVNFGYIKYQDSTVSLLATLNHVNLDQIAFKKTHEKEFKSYLINLLDEKTMIGTLLALKIVKSNKFNYIDTDLKFREEYFKRVLEFFSASPFFDSENTFCYSFAIDILFKDNLLLGKHTSQESLKLSIKIFEELFDLLANFQFTTDEKEHEKLSRVIAIHLSRCIHMGIINNLLDKDNFKNKLTIYGQKLEKYLTLKSDFSFIEQNNKEIINACLNENYYSFEDATVNRQSCLNVFQNLLSICMEKKGDSLVLLYLFNLIQKIESYETIN